MALTHSARARGPPEKPARPSSRCSKHTGSCYTLQENSLESEREGRRACIGDSQRRGQRNGNENYAWQITEFTAATRPPDSRHPHRATARPEQMAERARV